TLRCRDKTPCGEGFLRSGNRFGDVFGAGGWEGADDVVVICGVHVQGGFAARSGEPLTANQIVIRGVGHESPVLGSQFAVRSELSAVSYQWSVIPCREQRHVEIGGLRNEGGSLF